MLYIFDWPKTLCVISGYWPICLAQVLLLRRGSSPEIMPQAKFKVELPAKTSGVVSKVEADEMGIASMLLGGGRQKADDQLDYAVGIMMNKKVGDPVKAGESLLTIYSNREDVADIKQRLYDNIEVRDTAEPFTLIHETIR